MVDIIVYSYRWAPRPQKLFQLLALFKIPYKYCEIPGVQPRTQFHEIDIHYRRAPLMSIDSDLYVDTALMFEKLCDMAQHTDNGLTNCSNHPEFIDFGEALFPHCIGLLSRDFWIMKDKKIIADRTENSGKPFDPDQIVANRPISVSYLLSYLATIEKTLLKDKKYFLGDDHPTSADLNVYYAINWALVYTHSSEPEITRQTHSKIFQWLDNVATFVDSPREEQITWEDAKSILMAPPKHEYAKFVKHNENNPLKLNVGQRVAITPVDTGKSGVQRGALISLNDSQMCLRNDSGIVMHFPRIGYTVVAQK